MHLNQSDSWTLSLPKNGTMFCAIAIAFPHCTKKAMNLLTHQSLAPHTCDCLLATRSKQSDQVDVAAAPAGACLCLSTHSCWKGVKQSHCAVAVADWRWISQSIADETWETATGCWLLPCITPRKRHQNLPAESATGLCCMAAGACKEQPYTLHTSGNWQAGSKQNAGFHAQGYKLALRTYISQ